MRDDAAQDNDNEHVHDEDKSQEQHATTIETRKYFYLGKYPLDLKKIFGSIGVFCFFYLVVTYTNQLNILILATVLFLMALAIALPVLYKVTMQITHRNTLLVQEGWCYWLLSRRGFSVAVWFAWGLITSFALLIKMSFFRSWEWWFFLAMFPGFWLTYHLVGRGLQKKAASLYQYYFNLRLTCLIFPTWFALTYLLLPIDPAVGFEDMRLGEAMTVAMSSFDAESRSALLTDSRFLYLAIDVPQKWVIANLPGPVAMIALLLNVIAIWVLAFNLSHILTFLVLPKQELMRIVAPISDSAVPKPVSTSQIIYISTIATFFFFFVYVRVFVTMEAIAIQNPAYAVLREQAIGIQKLLVEEIDGKYYAPGTIDKLDNARNQLVGDSGVLATPLHDLTNRAFDEMEANTDTFLNNYYTLMADYARIGTAIVGSAEDHLKQKFTETVVDTASVRVLNIQLQEVIANNQALQSRFASQKAQILADNELLEQDLASQELEVVRATSIAEFDLLNAGLGTDIVSRGGVSAVSGLVAGKVTAKLSTKAAFKVASMALTKVASSAVSAGAGATIGGVVGSVVPVVGTLIGIGIGTGIGLSVDYAILKREERKNRGPFREQIIETLCESRVEMLNSFNASDDKFPSHCVR